MPLFLFANFTTAIMKGVINMLKLFIYLIVGFITVVGVLSIHLIRAELKGFAAFDWWDKHDPLYGETRESFLIKFLFGMMIWPIRVIQFVMEIEDLYEAYDRKW